MKSTRHILFATLMLLLILPAVQQYTGLIHEKPLKGAIIVPEKPKLSLKSWFDASFQEKYDDFLEQGIGFRPTLIRINNQVSYTLFDTALANSVIIGKNKCLYEMNYIKAYEGIDFVGYQKINEQVSEARLLQETLEREGKHFLILFAPGKASFFPEYIPEQYRTRNRKATNYEAYIKCCSDQGIHFIDYNSWFMSMKSTSKYPLYSRTGIHWSLYGVALAVDSLVKYMEKSASIDMVDFGWDNIEVTSKPRDTDNDIAEGMNLLFPISSGKLAYPQLKFGNPKGKTKPNVLVVGDSYYWNIMGTGTAAQLFGDNNFWFYNREAYNPIWPKSKDPKSLNILDEIKRQQFVILIATEANLSKFAFGFLDDYKNAIQNTSGNNPDNKNKEKRILEIMESIRNSKEWANTVKQKAIKKGISFEEMLRLDAEWVYDQKNTTH
jgi:hypothetical protein